MLSSLLDIVPGTGNQNPNNYYFSNAGEPLVYALIGFLIVFAGIVIIIGIIWFIGFILRKTNNFASIGEFFRKMSDKTAEEPEVEVAPQAADEEIPDEVKAAIVAAVTAYCVENNQCEFKVKRIKRI